MQERPFTHLPEPWSSCFKLLCLGAEFKYPEFFSIPVNTALLPLLPKAWHYKCVKPCLANREKSWVQYLKRCGYKAFKTNSAPSTVQLTAQQSWENATEHICRQMWHSIGDFQVTYISASIHFWPSAAATLNIKSYPYKQYILKRQPHWHVINDIWSRNVVYFDFYQQEWLYCTSKMTN